MDLFRGRWLRGALQACDEIERDSITQVDFAFIFVLVFAMILSLLFAYGPGANPRMFEVGNYVTDVESGRRGQVMSFVTALSGHRYDVRFTNNGVAHTRQFRESGLR